jgi:hypothetical protein
MNSQEFKTMCLDVVEELRRVAPRDTGNLALNAIRYEFPNADECRIYVDKAIAPYMPYTNEPWISPRWNGHKNPNEGWWNNATTLIAGILQNKYGE